MGYFMAFFHSLIITVIICVLLSQVLFVQGEKSKGIVYKKRISSPPQEFLKNAFASHPLKTKSRLNDIERFFSHSSVLQDTRHRDFPKNQAVKAYQYGMHNIRTQQSHRPRLQEQIQQHSTLKRSNKKDRNIRMKRSGSKEKNLKKDEDEEEKDEDEEKEDEDEEEDDNGTKRNRTVDSMRRYPMHPSLSGHDDTPTGLQDSKSRTNTDIESFPNLVQGGNNDESDDSSQSVLVFILPAVFAFLVISLLITLLMYRIQKKKAVQSSPREKSDIQDGSIQDTSHNARDEGEAIELVAFDKQHPSNDKGLLAERCTESERDLRESLILHQERSREKDIDLANPRPRYQREVPRRGVSATKMSNRKFQRQDSHGSHPCTEDEIGSFETIYISMPPRQPSENYIEAASTSTSVSSCKSVTTPKLEWLTKNILVDPKNETSDYQSEICTQTDSNVEPLFSKTVFGTIWQFGGTFTKNGGILQPENSDVFLTLVPNAITSKTYVDIYGAIFTDTQEIRKKFDIRGNETLITPLVEYHASGNYIFKRHVKISLPHALPEDSDVESLKVYGFSIDERGQLSVQLISRKKRGNASWDEECFWQFGDKDQNIKIWTTHFSGYFCTACESKSSMPSICARVFGSHVQIKSKRREIRIILYIWDRRLNIRDFLQRIIEQECEMDRQLIADQQIPLPENATSDSHIIMKMDTLGDEEDRICWQHVIRPNTGKPLFRPLQVRKLFQIIQCCQQADPLRVEWAMENVPGTVPSSVFQCCIDMQHTSESTTNFEKALEDGDEDYLRTFYVRDLMLSRGYPQQYGDEDLAGDMLSAPNGSHLKQVLSELSLQETESMCEAFGLAKKDIGNLSQKFPSKDKMKQALVEECCRRVGREHFSHHFPEVLKQIGLSHVLNMVEKDQQFPSNHLNLPQQRAKNDTIESTMEPKLCLSSRLEGNSSANNFKGLQKQFSDQSNEVFVHENKPSNHYGRNQVNVQIQYPLDGNGNHPSNFSREYSQSHRYYSDREPTSHHHVSSKSFSHGDKRYSTETSYQRQRHKYINGQKSSSSGSDSALRGNSINSSEVAMSSLDYVSMEAQADSKEFRGLDKKDELEEDEEETLTKDVVETEQGERRIGFPEIEENVLASRQGPVALSNRFQDNSRQITTANFLNSTSNNHSHTSQNSQHTRNSEETFCKESLV